MIAAGLLLGVLIVLPIGGADMPVVLALLNSYAGLASAATGLVISNNVLLIAGALDGTSGFFLSMMMSRAMNRSFTNVLFGVVGAVKPGTQTLEEARTVMRYPPKDAAYILENAQSVIIVPGYGMAVAQAQHAVQELAALLMERGISVRYAIHPVAGRMPGHMNDLLAEANVPYDLLCEPEQVNDDFQNTDVALVIGANDVVNPAARYKKASPLYGMPILNADQARTIMVLKWLACQRRTLSARIAAMSPITKEGHLAAQRPAMSSWRCRPCQPARVSGSPQAGAKLPAEWGSAARPARGGATWKVALQAG